ncbi:MAG: hypothetical protein J7M12_00385 [Candidatus Hydrogenedentes bacterium]|nr:hypothetical protein [Candidatus Hydrogenedentota bacterium]
MSAKKLVLIIICVIIGLPFLLKVKRFLTPESLTFSLIEQKFAATGLYCSPMQKMDFGYMPGAIDGRYIVVNNVPVSIFLFENTARRDIEYENNTQDVGEAIANNMGITTMLGVQTAPNPNKKRWPVKKKKYLFLPITDDEAAVRPVIDAIKRM